MDRGRRGQCFQHQRGEIGAADPAVHARIVVQRALPVGSPSVSPPGRMMVQSRSRLRRLILRPGLGVEHRTDRCDDSLRGERPAVAAGQRRDLDHAPHARRSAPHSRSRCCRPRRSADRQATRRRPSRRSHPARRVRTDALDFDGVRRSATVQPSAAAKRGQPLRIAPARMHGPPGAGAEAHQMPARSGRSRRTQAAASRQLPIVATALNSAAFTRGRSLVVDDADLQRGVEAAGQFA